MITIHLLVLVACLAASVCFGFFAGRLWSAGDEGYSEEEEAAKDREKRIIKDRRGWQVGSPVSGHAEIRREGPDAEIVIRPKEVEKTRTGEILETTVNSDLREDYKPNLFVPKDMWDSTIYEISNYFNRSRMLFFAGNRAELGIMFPVILEMSKYYYVDLLALTWMKHMEKS